MKVLDAKVLHNRMYANPPTLQILVDRIPLPEDMVYSREIREKYTYYFAEKEGYVSFFVHDLKNEAGFGGSVFTRKLTSGEIVSVKGPWSSRPAAMRKVFGVHSVDVNLTDDPMVLHRGFTFSAAHVTPDIAQYAMQFVQGYRLELVNKYGEDDWELVENEAVSRSTV